MKIPANVSSLKTKLSGAFTKKPEPTTKEPVINRHDGSAIAKQRAKAKALSDELANEKTTSERKQQIIDEMKAELEAKQLELETVTSQLSELTPKAKSWENYEHVERTKLIEQLPPEKKKEVKDLPLNLLRTFVNGVAGKPATQNSTTGGTDWKAIMETNDEEAINKAIASDVKGFNEFMDKQ